MLTPNDVAVVVPTRNRPATLMRAIRSLAQQTVRGFSVLVVDDASVDGVGVEAALHVLPSGIEGRLIRNPSPKGAQACRNRGIAASNTPWIAFLDDDDEWLPHKLERQLAAIDAVDVTIGLSYCWAETVDDDGRRIASHAEWWPSNGMGRLLEGCFIRSPSVMLSRVALDRVGLFDERLESCQDWDLWVRVVAGGFHVSVTPEVLVRVHAHSGARVGNSPRALWGYRQFFIKHRGLYVSEGRSRLLSEHLRWLGWRFVDEAEWVAAKECLRDSVQLDRLNWRSWVRLGQTLVREMQGVTPRE